MISLKRGAGLNLTCTLTSLNRIRFHLLKTHLSKIKLIKSLYSFFYCGFELKVFIAQFIFKSNRDFQTR